MGGRGDVVHQIVRVTRSLTHRVSDGLESTVREVGRRRLGITACVEAFAEEVASVVLVPQWCRGIRQNDLGEIAVGVVDVAENLAGRVGDLFDTALRITNKRDRQITGSTGDAVRRERQNVSVEVLDRLHLSSRRHCVHASVSIGVLISRRTVIDVEREEADYSRAGPDQQATAV